MERCPKCYRLGIERLDRFERCLWNGCGYVNRTGASQKYWENNNPIIKYKKFIDSIKIKKTISLETALT